MARPRPGAALVVTSVVVALAGVLLAGRLVGGGEQADAEGVHHGSRTSHVHTAPPADPGAGCQPGTPTSLETAYVTHMVEHHRQAVQMATLVRRADVPYRIRNLADHVAAVQRGEVADMRAWLAAWEQAAVPTGCADGDGDGDGDGDDGGHHHDASAGSGARAVPDATSSSMPGMLSEQSLEELAGMRGVAAGRRYVELMIEHHRGAVTMSEPLIDAGANPWVLSLARHVVADQQVEIDAMRRILRST